MARSQFRWRLKSSAALRYCSAWPVGAARRSRRNRGPHYQTNLALTWPMRGSCALVTAPNRPLLKLPSGLLNWVWLKMLKNSPRISIAMDSVIGILFEAPKSVFTYPGPWKNRRLAVAKRPIDRDAERKASGRKYSYSGPLGRGSWHFECYHRPDQIRHIHTFRAIQRVRPRFG